ncbi:sensor domain-containing phosphodiesterase [Massilia sp. RP-1-19]|uniref:Sensor domain-containing phosphodiesterase n=1 Tax=Massilia polaris TaxID=2728846 RepID=A0A848HGJ5_9BURK|nr:EAL domain-containing protein [Massilia polaris]NML61006.1 sensor domain-containing phosphodiesterase [Massilia polaris]
MFNHAIGNGNAAPTVANGSISNALERSTRAFRTLSAGTRTLLRATNEAQLLQDMCTVIVETGGYRRAGVAYASEDEQKSMRWVVQVGMNNGKAQPVDVSWLNAFGFTYADIPAGRTAVGTAIRTRAPCVGRDILNSPLYAEPQLAIFRQQALDEGYASVTAFPLVADGHVLGALFMAAAEPDAFHEEEVRLLADMADDLAFGITSLRIRELHRAAQATIEKLAFFDTESGLPNRTLQLQAITAFLKQARAENVPLSLVHLKISRFEEISHVLGYQAADQLMKEIARRLSGWASPERPLARIGEACFSMILHGASMEDATAFAHTVLQALDDPIEVCGVALDAPVHASVACDVAAAMAPETLFRHANAALYHGTPVTDRVKVFANARAADYAGRLSLLGDLRRAVERNELRLYCQPKVDMRSGKVTGAEALVRWAHPRLGMVLPSHFIQLAEQSGMITHVTNWVLNAAFSQLRAWPVDDTPQTLAINISAYDFRNPTIVRQIDNLLSAWRIDPARVQFELTESALIDDPGATLVALSGLKALGVELLIDDFGTGYSSLSYLQKFPVDGIKIDQSFVMPMLDSPDSAAIVRSTIELGHTLSRHIVAEGVESEALWERLADEGCDVAQGYFIGEPMPIEDFPQWRAGWEARHVPKIH